MQTLASADSGANPDIRDTAGDGRVTKLLPDTTNLLRVGVASVTPGEYVRAGNIHPARPPTRFCSLPGGSPGAFRHGGPVRERTRMSKRSPGRGWSRGPVPASGCLRQQLAAAPPERGPATSSSSAAPAGKVGVILPDSASSARWETADRQYLTEAFKAAGVESDIQNANGDKAKFADAVRPVDQRRRQRPPDRQPRQRDRRGLRDQGRRPGHQDRSTTTASPSVAARRTTCPSTTSPSAPQIGEGLVKCMQRRR